MGNSFRPRLAATLLALWAPTPRLLSAQAGMPGELINPAPVPVDDDPRCCHSADVTVHLQLQDDALVLRDFEFRQVQ